MESRFSKRKKTKQYKRAEYLLKVELLQTSSSMELFEAKLIYSDEIESSLGEIKGFESFDAFYKYSNTTMLREKIKEEIINKECFPAWQVEKCIIDSGTKEKVIKVILDIDYNVIAWLAYPEFEAYCKEPYQKELFDLTDKLLSYDEEFLEHDMDYNLKEDGENISFGDIFEEETDEETCYHIYLGKNSIKGYGIFISTKSINNNDFVIDNVFRLSKLKKMKKKVSSENRLMNAASLMLKSNPFEVLYWRLHYINTKLHYPKQLDEHMARTIRFSVDSAIKNDKFQPQI